MQNQAYVFAIFILNGLLIGILFDIFRIFRKSFKTPDFITYIEDILFWLISGLILLYSIFKFNNGELRLFIFFGVILGLIMYVLVFSKMFIQVSVNIICFTKKIIYTLLVVPIKYAIKLINKLIFKPTVFFCINITKFFKKTKLFSKKIMFKHGNLKNKKDFA